MEDKDVVKMWGKYFLALVVKVAAAWFVILAAVDLYYWLFVY